MWHTLSRIRQDPAADSPPRVPTQDLRLELSAQQVGQRIGKLFGAEGVASG